MNSGSGAVVAPLLRSLVVLASVFSLMTSAWAESSVPAKKLFGSRDMPAELQPRSLGSYAKGCLAGGVALPVNGPYWQAMRLSRNRNWGHPALVSYVSRLAEAVVTHDGWNGLMVGDLAQPRGGPMISGHSSHQIGLDADIWLRPMPDRTLTREEREKISAISVLKKNTLTVDDNVWTDSHFNVLKRAASYGEVARIFVNPGIKRKLCDSAGGDRNWLRKIRAWHGHHYHFHVRLKCPIDSVGCKNQAAPPAGDGCGKELASWFKPKPKKKVSKAKKKTKKKVVRRRFTQLSDLPNDCRMVLNAAAPGGIEVPQLGMKWPPYPWELAPVPFAKPTI